MLTHRKSILNTCHWQYLIKIIFSFGQKIIILCEKGCNFWQCALQSAKSTNQILEARKALGETQKGKQFHHSASSTTMKLKLLFEPHMRSTRIWKFVNKRVHNGGCSLSFEAVYHLCTWICNARWYICLQSTSAASKLIHLLFPQMVSSTEAKIINHTDC